MSGSTNGGSPSAGSAGRASAGTNGGGAGGDEGGSSSGAGAAGNPEAGATNAGAAGTGGASGGGTSGTAGAAGAGGSERPAVLVFSRTTGFRHDSIVDGIQALTNLAEERGWTLFASEDAALFNAEALAPYNVIVFLSTTGDVLNATQQSAFEAFIRSGKGFVGIHSASDTEYDWPFYGELIGAYFDEHPAIQPATVEVENRTHPATAGLPELWMRTDEWYGFRSNPRQAVEVLLSLDETSYDPGGSAMDGDHPIAWFHEYESARVFYTALGHTSESYSEALFLEHIAGGIEWAARLQ
jgi:type 1 glutamine amidotransferase